jgi:hypothetical protein
LARGLVASSGGLVRADEPRLRIEIQGDDTLPRMAHLQVPVLVELDVAMAAPLLLTPSVEGFAVEVVRGRLLRSDAKPVDASHLRFDIPVVARSEGTAIFRVELSTYVCEPRCRLVTASGSRVLRVR